MTNQNVPADKVRKIVNDMRRHAEHDAVRGTEEEYTLHFAALLEALLPPPPRPTLADMTEQEQRDAVGMWADVDGFHPYRAVIGDTPAPKVPVFRPTTGALDWVYPEDVTPLPELGRAHNPDGTPTDRTRPGVPAHRLQELLDSVAGYPADDDPVRALGALMSGLTGLIREELA